MDLGDAIEQEIVGTRTQIDLNCTRVHYKGQKKGIDMKIRVDNLVNVLRVFINTATFGCN